MKNLKTNLALLLMFTVGALSAQQQTPTADTLAAKQKIKEYGLGFTGLNSYSLQYRWGSPKLLYRINGNIGFTNVGSNSDNNAYDQIYGNSGSTTTQKQTKTPLNLNTGLSFSVLSLKQINPKFGCVLGGIAGLTYSYSTSQLTATTTDQNITNGNTSQTSIFKTNSQTLQPYLGCVLGVYYKINPSFIIYAEISPNIYFESTQTKSNTTFQYYPATPYTRSSDAKITNNTLGISGLTNSGAMITRAYRITK
jgi:hypothetical protein